MSTARSDRSPAGARAAGDAAATLGALLERLAPRYGVPAAEVRRVWRVAGLPAFASAAAPSAICDDGTPFELSVTVGDRPGRGGLRYLTELGDGAPGGRRLADARRRLPALLGALGLPREPLLGRVDRSLPRPIESFPDLAFGLWVCPVLLPGGNRLKTYLNTSWWDPAEDRPEARLLASMGRPGRELPSWPPAFVGLESAAGGRGRTKLYFRGRPLERDRVLALSGGADARTLAELWDAFLPGRALGPEEGVLSIRGRALEETEPRRSGRDRRGRVKIDFAAGALGLSEAEIPGRVESVARRLDLDPGDYFRALELGGLLDGGWSHTMLGITAPAGRPRINVYLKPVLRDARSLVRVVRTVLSTRPAYARTPAPGRGEP